MTQPEHQPRPTKESFGYQSIKNLYDWDQDKLTKQLNIRKTLMRQLVGNLYKSIIYDEITKIQHRQQNPNQPPPQNHRKNQPKNTRNITTHMNNLNQPPQNKIITPTRRKFFWYLGSSIILASIYPTKIFTTKNQEYIYTPDPITQTHLTFTTVKYKIQTNQYHFPKTTKNNQDKHQIIYPPWLHPEKLQET